MPRIPNPRSSMRDLERINDNCTIAMLEHERADKLRVDLDKALEAQRTAEANEKAADRERDAVVILLRAKTDDTTWAKYPDSMKDAVDAEYAELRADLDKALEALGKIRLLSAGALVGLASQIGISNDLTCRPCRTRYEAWLRARVAELQGENERLTVQLAGCSVAAEGLIKDPATRDQWGWSPAYQEVLELRLKYNEAIRTRTLAQEASTRALEAIAKLRADLLAK